MLTDRPTASVSGTSGWAWNEWQAERRDRSGRGDGRADGGRVPRGDRRRVTRHDHRDRRALERALDREARRRQAVIAQYERLLAERNRELERAGEDRPDARSTTLLDVLRQVAIR